MLIMIGQAVDALQKVIEIDPDDVEAHDFLNQLLLR